MASGLEEGVYHPVTYRVEIVERGEVIGEWRTLEPLVPFSAGDLLDPRGLPFTRWPGREAVVEAEAVLEVVRVEHLVMAIYGELMDSIQLHCRRVPDTYDTRGRPS